MALERIDVKGLDGVLKMLKSLPPEIVSRRGGPVKAALRKAAQVIQKQAKLNLQAIMDAPNEGGVDDPTGLLRDSIIVSRDPRPQQSGANERYLVRVKKKRYPKQPRVTTQRVGYLLEIGTERRRAMPWMRPAFEAKKGQAVTVFVDTLTKSIDRIIKKLAAR